MKDERQSVFGFFAQVEEVRIAVPVVRNSYFYMVIMLPDDNHAYMVDKFGNMATYHVPCHSDYFMGKSQANKVAYQVNREWGGIQVCHTKKHEKGYVVSRLIDDDREVVHLHKWGDSLVTLGVLAELAKIEQGKGEKEPV